MRRQLEKAGEKKNSLQVQLEQKTHEEMKTMDLLKEKVTEVHLLKQETQQVILTVVSLGLCVCVSVEHLMYFTGQTLIKHGYNYFHSRNMSGSYHT